MITKEMVQCGFNQGTLENFRPNQDFSNEYGYYEGVLRESLSPGGKPSIGAALLFPEFVASEIRKEGFK